MKGIRTETDKNKKINQGIDHIRSKRTIISTKEEITKKTDMVKNKKTNKGRGIGKMKEIVKKRNKGKNRSTKKQKSTIKTNTIKITINTNQDNMIETKTKKESPKRSKGDIKSKKKAEKANKEIDIVDKGRAGGIRDTIVKKRNLKKRSL